MPETVNAEALKLAIAGAVPLWIERIRPMGEAWIMDRAKEIGEKSDSTGQRLVGSDALLYRSSKPGETAKAFNALAEGIACMSFAPGGVTAFGMHFDGRRKLGTGEIAE